MKNPVGITVPGEKIEYRMSNKEPQNVEVWYRSRSAGACVACRAVFFIQDARMHYFDIHVIDIEYSIFDFHWVYGLSRISVTGPSLMRETAIIARN
jgi:hypothetical protein